MNIALWAEIRRLAEIEKLSRRAIARRSPLRAADGGRGIQTGSSSPTEKDELPCPFSAGLASVPANTPALARGTRIQRACGTRLIFT